MRDFTPEDVFRLHPKIRWAGLVSEKGEVAFVKMRPGVNSLSPEEEDRSFMEMNPLLILGAGSRLSKWAGEVESIAIRYEKIVMYLMRKHERILALTMDKESEAQGDHAAITEISSSLDKLMAQSQ
jgi:hypothetical protein